MVMLELLLLAGFCVGYIISVRWLLGPQLTPLMLFGFFWLLLMSALSILLAAGHVEEATSFGLMPIVTALAGMGGSWGTAAFQHAKDERKDAEIADLRTQLALLRQMALLKAPVSE